MHINKDYTPKTITEYYEIRCDIGRTYLFNNIDDAIIQTKNWISNYNARNTNSHTNDEFDIHEKKHILTTSYEILLSMEHKRLSSDAPLKSTYLSGNILTIQGNVFYQR